MFTDNLSHVNSINTFGYLKTQTIKHETNRTEIKMPIKEFIIKIMHPCEKRITFKNETLIFFLKSHKDFKCFGGNTTSVYRFLKSYDSISKMLESQVPLKRCNLIAVVL